MDDNDLISHFTNFTANLVRKQAVTNCGSTVGQITAISSDLRYDIQGTDNDATYLYVYNSLLNVTWNLGDWVTIQWTGVDYAIVGTSPVSGQPLP